MNGETFGRFLVALKSATEEAEFIRWWQKLLKTRRYRQARDRLTRRMDQRPDVRSLTSEQTIQACPVLAKAMVTMGALRM